MANAIDIALFNLYTDVSTSINPESGDTWYDTLVNARVQLNKQLAPDNQERYFVGSDDVEGEILKTDQLVRWDATGVGGQQSPILNGELGRAAGFRLFRGTNVPSVGSPAVTKNLAFHRNAFALVSRPLATAAPGQTPGAVQSTVFDEDFGLAMRTTMSYDAKKLATLVTVDVLFGVKTLDADLAVRIDV